VKVSVLLTLVMAGLKVAVTPAGSPVVVMETLLPELLFCLTEMVLAVFDPASRVRELADDEIVKLGSGIVKIIVAAPVRVPEVPVTVTG